MFCALDERQYKKINPIMIRRFIFLRQQDHKTTRLQVFWGNVEGRFLLFLKLRNSKPQNLRRKIRADTCDTWRFIKIHGEIIVNNFLKLEKI